jgi:photosystem II stability/assembly factor-like uncharacterized protein
MKTFEFLFLLLTPVCLFAQQATWELVRESFYGKIAIDPTNPDIIYVSPGNIQYGLHKSTDGGKTWVYYDIGYGTEDGGILIDPNNTQRLWIYGSAFKGLVRSEDGGMTAVRADTGISFDHHGYSVYALAYDHIRNILYAGDDSLIPGGIYRSFDGGRRWELIAAFGSSLNFISKYLLVEEEAGWLYSGSTSSGIRRSKDFGLTWTLLQPAVLGGMPIAFIAKVPNSRTMYAVGGVGRVFKSYNLGETWKMTIPAILDSSLLVSGLLISSLDTNFVYVGAKGGSLDTKGGFYLSRDGGENWELYHAGLPQYELFRYLVRSLAQTPDSRYLYMSLSSGPRLIVFKLSQSLLTSVREQPHKPVPSIISLQQNYPNPFNSQTRIAFSVAKRNSVSVTVYSAAGKYVVDLFNGPKDAGNHFVTWNGKNSKGGEVGSGIYLIRLQAEQEIWSVRCCSSVSHGGQP